MAPDDTPLWRLFREGSDDDVRRFMLLLRPPELADVLERTPEDERVRVLRLMGVPLQSEVLREVDEPQREDILEDLSSSEIAEIVHESKSDDAADLVQSLPPERQERTLEKLAADERQEIEGLLGYGEETAGGIMQTEVVTVPSDRTVGEAIEAVRASDIEDVGEIHEVFVVDRDGRLVGTIGPADLLHEDPKNPLRAILEPDPITVPVTMDQEKIAAIVREHDLATVPVVDEDGVLAGQILHDDIVDVIQEEATEDIAKMAGADPEEVYTDEVWKAIRARIPWLLPPFLGGLTVSVLMHGADIESEGGAIVAAYLVIVVGMAGSLGTQNAAVTVRSLALGRVGARSLQFVARQVATGLALGVLYGICLFLIALLKEDSAVAAKWSAILGCAIFVAMTVGALMGVTVPLVLHKLGADPAVAASPFIQTANDVVGAGILIGTVHWFGG